MSYHEIINLKLLVERQLHFQQCIYLCSEQSNNLLIYGSEQLQVTIPKMSSQSRIELLNFRITHALNSHYGGTGWVAAPTQGMNRLCTSQLRKHKVGRPATWLHNVKSQNFARAVSPQLTHKQTLTQSYCRFDGHGYKINLTIPQSMLSSGSQITDCDYWFCHDYFCSCFLH